MRIKQTNIPIKSKKYYRIPLLSGGIFLTSVQKAIYFSLKQHRCVEGYRQQVTGN
jgi:hypothetical protein